MLKDKKRIIIIGPYPPPYGGVSIHIKRLSELLQDDYSIDIIDESGIKKSNVFNLRNYNLFGYFRMMQSADIVHIHSGLLSLRIFHFLIAGLLFKKRIITIHGYEPGRGLIERKLDKFMCRKSEKTIFVNREIAQRIGVMQYSVMNAFLPPGRNEEKDLPDDLANWIQERKTAGYYICSANAWRLDMHLGQDMYGLDLCISTAKELREQGMKTAFVFIVCQDTGKIKLDTYRRLIAEYELGECFLLYESPVSFIRLIKESDIIVRPTNTDGDALTIREGLFFGKKVIASDVVQRPVGVMLFQNRNVVSLTETIKRNLDLQTPTENHQMDRDIFREYRELYNSEVYNV